MYVDVHLIHEVTSPQAFANIRQRSASILHPDQTFGVPDHNIETKARRKLTSNFGNQVDVLIANCTASLVECSDPFASTQGIVHVVSPGQALTTPGRSIVCGDSHTSTHGALASLSQGIGTTEVEGVLATQVLSQKKNRTMLIRLCGTLQPNCSPKDLILGVIRLVGAYGGTGYAISFADETLPGLSPEGRMTLSNMAIEAGAKVSIIAANNTTANYLRLRATTRTLSQPERLWKSYQLKSHPKCSRSLVVNVSSLRPQVTWGTSPEMVVAVDERTPNPKCFSGANTQRSYSLALNYMALPPNTPMAEVTVEYAFIGSCTNSRITDLREAATATKRWGGKISKDLRGAIIVPGSGQVKMQAEREGLVRLLSAAGFEWREPGCSMCIAMNQDRLRPRERCVSTSNRNFEGRQGALSRTHLVSPSTAALTALTGRITQPKC